MQKVILAGIELANQKDDFSSKMEETKALADALGIEVLETITQRSRSLDQKTAFRKGKLEELKLAVQATEADGVIFYNTLPVKMVQRIANIIDVEVKDRTDLILDIFSLRARSRQAKLQTELARLQYALPSVLSDVDEEGHARGGGVTNRGAGEMRSSIIARKYAARMQDIKQELKKVEKQRYQDERRRTKTMFKRVGLVGYTNAGKSSLMNTILDLTNAKGKTVLEKDMLFATLDTSVRTIIYRHKQFLLYDTVGFVSDLPHGLIEAFQTTLDSARDADLLIHVVDASDPSHLEKEQITLDTLQEIGAGDIPILTVYNKIDIQDTVEKNGIRISCLTKNGIKEMLDALMEKLYPIEEKITCFIPYDKIDVVSAFTPVLHMDILEANEDGQYIQLAGEKQYIQYFKKYEEELQ